MNNHNTMNFYTPKIPVISISRLRFNTDGKGITALVGISGCPNKCRYCINANLINKTPVYYSPQELFEKLRVDDIYFRTTGGGITFGGGEPLVWSNEITEFAKLVHHSWNINIETSLNIPWKQVEIILPYTNQFIIDIKDMNEDIYRSYTEKSGECMRQNLSHLIELVPEKLRVRVPHIPGFNTDADVNASKNVLLTSGISNIDEFTYTIRNK